MKICRVVQRKHLVFGKESIKYVGKEANNLEFSMIRGVFADDNIEYVNHQKKIRETIASLTWKKAVELEMEREYYRLKKKLESDKPIVLRKKMLEKLNHLNEIIKIKKNNTTTYYKGGNLTKEFRT